MSILFEAWRRARGEGQEVARALGAPPAVQASAGRLLPWILCVLLAALAAALGVYLWRLGRAPRPAAARVAAASAARAAPAPASVRHANRAPASAGPAAAVRVRHGARAGTAAAANGHGARGSGAARAVAATAATQAVPDAVRAALPPLPVTVHVWNPAPAARFIIVHGHMYHEGDEIAPGVRLVTITRAGEIVGFRGYEISLGGT